MRNDDFIIISVESRKGGVGKTTIALNLASLLKQNYHVLILDVDVTGTSISAIRDTSTWEKSVRLLENSKGEPINLLQLFKTKYLSGNYDMRFSLEPEKKGAITVYNDYINVISSELYGEDGTLLYDPSIIFDEIHDFWLLDMIQRIAKSFSNVFDDKKSIIILDNSPGYVGLGKSIHDLLTDYGPTRGKFLSVSSLDYQDIDSCLKAIHNIHSIIIYKVKGANHFHDKNSNLSDLDNVGLAMFDRLAIGEESLQFYSSGLITELELNSYQALVINKVPISVKNGLYDYSYYGNSVFEETFETLCGRDPRPYMIPFDQSIHYQFFRRNIIMREQLNQESFLDLKRAISRLHHYASKMYNDHMGNEQDQIRRVNQYMTLISRILNDLNQADLSYHINEDWNPKSIFMELFESLQKMGMISPFRSYSFPMISAKRFALAEKQTWDSFFTDKDLLNAVNYTLRALEFFLLRGDVTKEKFYGSVSMVFQKLLEVNGHNTITRDDLLSYVKSHRGLIGSDEELFQFAFVVSILRVLDLPEDILFLCEILARYFFDDYKTSSSTAEDIIRVVNKKIITKELSINEAFVDWEQSAREAYYMDVVCKSISPIIEKWGL